MENTPAQSWTGRHGERIGTLKHTRMKRKTTVFSEMVTLRYCGVSM